MVRAQSEPLGVGVKGLCIATRCESVDDFITKFHAYCGDDTMFVATTTMRAIGNESPFVILLADKTPVMRGWCVVHEAWPDGDNPFDRPGIQIKLDRLTPSSREVFEQLKAVRDDAQAAAIPQVMQPRAPTMLGISAQRAPVPVQDGPTERMNTPPAGVVELGLAVPLPPLPPKERRTKGMRIATPCETVDEFIDAFHACCEPGSFFIATRSMRAIGLESAFSVDLASGKPMLRGYCVVLDAWPTADNRFKRPGVRIGLQQLTADSRAVLDRLLAARGNAGEAVPQVAVERMTRQMVALGTPKIAVPVIKPMSKPRIDATTPRIAPRATPVAVTPVAAAAGSVPTAVDDNWSTKTELDPRPAAAVFAPVEDSWSTKTEIDPSPARDVTPVTMPEPAPIAAALEPARIVTGAVEPRRRATDAEITAVKASPEITPLPPAPMASIEISPALLAERIADPTPLPAPIAAPEEPVDIACDIEPPPLPAPPVVRRQRPRWIGLAAMLVIGASLGAVIALQTRPEAPAPITRIVTVPIAMPAPAAAPPVQEAPAPAQVAPPAVAPAPIAKPHPVVKAAPPVKRLPPVFKRQGQAKCAGLDCL